MTLRKGTSAGDGAVGAAGSALLIIASLVIAMTGAPSFALWLRRAPVNRFWLWASVALFIAVGPWGVVAWLASL